MATQVFPSPRADEGGRLEATAIARSPVHHLHQRLSATFRRMGAYEVPVAYQDPKAEREAVASGLAIADVTAQSRIDLRGPIDEMVARLPPAPDVVRARLSATWALLLSPPSSSDAYLRAAEAAAGSAGMASDATSLYAAFAIAGPKTDELVARLSALDPRTLPPGGATGTQLAKIAAVLVRLSAPTPLLEVLVGSEYGRYAWEALLEVGHSLGACPVGWDAIGWSQQESGS